MDLTRKNSYSLIGYRCGGGGLFPGTEEGPKQFRELGLIERLVDLGLLVDDLGDAVPSKAKSFEQQLENASEGEKGAHSLLEVFSACSALAEKVETALERRTVPIIIGGDHSLSIGSVAGVSNFYGRAGQSVGLLWIDTHGDINSPESSPSGRIHGMPVTALLGKMPGVLSSLQKTNPAIRAENLAYVGLRELDPGEKVSIRDLGIKAFTMKEVDILGIARVMEEAIGIASSGTAGFIASFDLDVCDPQLVPGTGTPKRGGLTFREAHLSLEMIYDSAKMLSLELVELNPKLDKDNVTAELAISLIESALGRAIL